jgi:hypothetical protein
MPHRRTKVRLARARHAPSLHLLGRARHVPLQSQIVLWTGGKAPSPGRGTWPERLDDPLPESLATPEAVAHKGSVELTVAGRHLPPGCWCPQHPEDAGEHRAVVVIGPSHRGPLRREEVTDALPLFVGQGACWG